MKKRTNFKASKMQRLKKAEPSNYQDLFADKQRSKGKFPQGKVSIASNDAAWYTKNPSLMRDVASFSFNNPLGSPFRIADEIVLSSTETISAETGSLPGLMAFRTVMTPGVSTSAQSPVNMAAQNVYSYVRHENSGSRNYDSPDLMLYLLAMDSLYAAWNWMKRIYGTVASYNQLNYYMPRAYLLANNVDFYDIQQHLADFRGYLNKAAAQIVSFCVPATMNFVVRHSWMFSNIYKDSDTAKAQQYMFVPSVFYQFDETSKPKGGILTPIPVTYGVDISNPTLFKFSDLVAMLDGMINALNYSEDMAIMSGDILKAYGDGSLVKLSAIDPEYTVMPVYNTEVLSQIENIKMLPMTVDNLDSLNIGQNPNTNFISYNPIFNTSNPMVRQGCFINMHKENVTPEEMMVATRLSAIGTSGNDSSYGLYTSGSEFITIGIIYTFTDGSGPSSPVSYIGLDLTARSFTNVIAFDPTSKPNSLASAVTLSQYLNFDWAPHVMLLISSGGTGNSYYAGYATDFDMYTFVSKSNMEAMNTAALLSEFDIPANHGTF